MRSSNCVWPAAPVTAIHWIDPSARCSATSTPATSPRTVPSTSMAASYVTEAESIPLRPPHSALAGGPGSPTRRRCSRVARRRAAVGRTRGFCVLGDSIGEVAEVTAQLVEREGKAEDSFHFIDAQLPQDARLAQSAHGVTKLQQGRVDSIEGRRRPPPADGRGRTHQIVRDDRPQVTHRNRKILVHGLEPGLGDGTADG